MTIKAHSEQILIKLGQTLHSDDCSCQLIFLFSSLPSSARLQHSPPLLSLIPSLLCSLCNTDYTESGHTAQMRSLAKLCNIRASPRDQKKELQTHHPQSCVTMNKQNTTGFIYYFLNKEHRSITSTEKLISAKIDLNI